MKRRGGIIVTQSYEIEKFPLNRLTDKYITTRICRGHSYSSVATGLEWIASGKYPLKELMTHHYPLSQTDVACLASGGEGEGAEPNEPDDTPTEANADSSFTVLT